ncbi:MAG: DUF1295 domain-containing protein [Pseudomonadota bacterium]
MAKVRQKVEEALRPLCTEAVGHSKFFSAADSHQLPVDAVALPAGRLQPIEVPVAGSAGEISAWAPFVTPLLVALIGFSLIWPISLKRQDVSLVDVAWGPGFAVQVVVAAYGAGAFSDRAKLLIALVCIWSLRLGYVLVRRRLREGHEDGRYTIIRRSWGPSFWWKSFFIVFVLQAFLQWLIAIGPIAGVVASNQVVGWLSLVGCLFALSGLSIETRADYELDQFKRSAPSGSLMKTGLRAHVRHPNYLGEMVFWVGIAMICVEGGAWVGLASPILIVVFLLKVSGAPLLDERLSATRPDYEEYKRRVPAFIPRLSALRTAQ